MQWAINETVWTGQKTEPRQQFVLIPENMSYIFQRKKPPKPFQPSQMLERLRAGHFVSTKAPSASHQLAELYRTNSLGQDSHSVQAPTPDTDSLLCIHLLPIKRNITYSNHLLPIRLLKDAHCLLGLSWTNYPRAVTSGPLCHLQIEQWLLQQNIKSYVVQHPHDCT